MNKKHPILTEILTVLKRVQANNGRFNLCELITQFPNVVTDEAEAYECGTVACVAGWYMLSPEAKARGFFINHLGNCQYKDSDYTGLVVLDTLLREENSPATSLLWPAADALKFYDVKNADEITLDVAIEKIQNFLDDQNK